MNSTTKCRDLVWEMGIPNVVQCDIKGSINWTVGGQGVNVSDPLYRKIYGYVPQNGRLYVYHPKQGQIIECFGTMHRQCYRTVLKRCKSATCRNGGRCKMTDPGTPIERITCICEHLSRGYRCDEEYGSTTWVTILLWFAVLFEIAMIAAAIYRNEHQRIYKDAIHRRFVDVLRQSDELFK